MESTPSSYGNSFAIPAPKEKIKMYSPAFYAACTAGGIFSCGLTHMAVTPLDLVKCNMQIDPAKYKNISSGFGLLLKEQGARGFFQGWVPTLLGYSAQGACKFGFYEFFKKYYSDMVGASEQNFDRHDDMSTDMSRHVDRGEEISSPCRRQDDMSFFFKIYYNLLIVI